MRREFLINAQVIENQGIGISLRPGGRSGKGLSLSNAINIVESLHQPARKKIIRMDRNIMIGVAIVIMLFADVESIADTGKDKTALAAAEKWVALIDAGNYADSWKEATAYFKDTFNQEKWEHIGRTVREPFGKIVSRKLKKRIYQSGLPGASNRESVIIRFATSLQNMNSADEVVTLKLDEDGQWRVTGYWITQGSPGLRGILMALLLLLVIIGLWFMELKPKWRFFK